MDAAIIQAGGVDLTEVIEACIGIGIDEAVVVGSSIGDHLIETPVPAVIIGVLNPMMRPDGKPTTEPSGPKPVATFTNFDVLLRVGMAIERGTPTCLIVPPPLKAPSGLPSLVVVPCSLGDRESLRLHLWAFTATLSEPSNPQAAQSIEGKRINTEQFMRLVESTRMQGDSMRRALEFERLTARLLEEAGIELAENPDSGRRDEGFDLAVLPSRSSSEVVFVQVKAGRLDERRLHDAELRLQEAIIDRHGQLGLLVYQDNDGRLLPPRRAMPLVVRIALEDLIHRLGNEDFRQILDDEVAKAAERI